MACMDAANGPAILQVALAEFSALRSEIKDRSDAAWGLVNLDVTGTAALLGLVLSKNADPKLLLALPLLAPALGLLFIDHAYNINNLGSYINKRLRPLVVEATGSADVLGYEDAIDRYEKHRFLRLVPLGLPLTLLFSGLPLAALVFVVPSLDAAWAWVVWAFGVLLMLVQSSLWLIFMFDPRRLDPLRTT
jgi:hypothetical protein